MFTQLLVNIFGHPCTVSSMFGRKPYGHKRSQRERDKQRAVPDIIKNVDFSEFEESVAGDKVCTGNENTELG